MDLAEQRKEQRNATQGGQTAFVIIMENIDESAVLEASRQSLLDVVQDKLKAQGKVCLD